MDSSSSKDKRLPQPPGAPQPLQPGSVSVPGSLMLFGEHAVLRGAPAVVTAVDQRMQLELRPNDDGQLRIASALGEYEAPVDALRDDDRFRFLLEAVRRAGPSGGFDLSVASEFSATIGFGSSAAVTVGAVALLHPEADPRAVFDESLAVVRSVQGRGSGADVAASVFGGVVGYRIDPVEIEPLEMAVPPPVSVVYCGYKVQTPQVIAHVAEREERQPELVRAAFTKLGHIAGVAMDAIQDGDWDMVGRLMNMHQSLADTLGINTPELRQIASGLCAAEGMFGAKITGAGLGDCVIGVGAAGARVPGFRSIPVGIGAPGLRRTQ